MDTDRARSTVFFIAYFLLLVYGLVWVQFGYVRERVGDNIDLFYVLDGLGICYVCLRGYLVIGKRVSRGWEPVWLAIDLIIITGLVRLTGGIRSEAALMYFLPVATSSIQRRLGMTISVGLAGAALYLAATWTPDFTAREMAMLGTRLFVLLLVTLHVKHPQQASGKRPHRSGPPGRPPRPDRPPPIPQRLILPHQPSSLR